MRKILGDFPVGRENGAGRKRVPPQEKGCQLRSVSVIAAATEHKDARNHDEPRGVIVEYTAETVIHMFPPGVFRVLSAPIYILCVFTGLCSAYSPSPVILWALPPLCPALPASLPLPSLLRRIFQPAFPLASPPALPRSQRPHSRPGARALPKISFPSAI